MLSRLAESFYWIGRYIERARARRLLDARSAEEILGYDDDGLPQ